MGGKAFQLAEAAVQLAEAGNLMDCIESHNLRGGKVKEEKHTGSIMMVTRPDSPL